MFESSGGSHEPMRRSAIVWMGNQGWPSVKASDPLGARALIDVGEVRVTSIDWKSAARHVQDPTEILFVASAYASKCGMTCDGEFHT